MSEGQYALYILDLQNTNFKTIAILCYVRNVYLFADFEVSSSNRTCFQCFLMQSVSVHTDDIDKVGTAPKLMNSFFITETEKKTLSKKETNEVDSTDGTLGVFDTFGWLTPNRYLLSVTKIAK